MVNILHVISLNVPQIFQSHSYLSAFLPSFFFIPYQVVSDPDPWDFMDWQFYIAILDRTVVLQRHHLKPVNVSSYMAKGSYVEDRIKNANQLTLR
jgi:hypothetical protein